MKMATTASQMRPSVWRGHEGWSKSAQTKQSLKLIAVKLESHPALPVDTHVPTDTCQQLAFISGSTVPYIESQFPQIRASLLH